MVKARSAIRDLNLVLLGVVTFVGRLRLAANGDLQITGSITLWKFILCCPMECIVPCIATDWVSILLRSFRVSRIFVFDPVIPSLLFLASWASKQQLEFVSFSCAPCTESCL